MVSQGHPHGSYKLNGKTVVTVLSVVLLTCFGIYLVLYLQGRSAELELSRAEPQVLDSPAIEKPNKVSLKTYVTTCQELTETIPLAGGGAIKSTDLRMIEGRVRNNGNVAVQFVKVMIHWRDKDDRIVDYEEVYAVSEEQLLPGAEASFRSSKRNSLISRCTAKVQDWWVVSDEEVDAKRLESQG